MIKSQSIKETNILDQNSSDVSSDFDYTGKQVLIDLESIRNYNTGVATIIKKYMEESTKIVDFGAGIGTLAHYFPKDRITCLEIDGNQRGTLLSRGFKVVRSLDEIPADSLSFLYSSNVLEHIENDYQTVKEINKKLKRKGRVVFYLPAFPSLYSDMDKKVGHFRRYTKQRLTDVFLKANFEVEKIFYSDSLGFFVTLLYKIIGSKEGVASLKQLLFYDRVIYPVSRFLDTILFSRLFGKNIVIVARKK